MTPESGPVLAGETRERGRMSERLYFGRGMRLNPETGEISLDADAVHNPPTCCWGTGESRCAMSPTADSPFCEPHRDEAHRHFKADQHGWGIAIG